MAGSSDSRGTRRQLSRRHGWLAKSCMVADGASHWPSDRGCAARSLQLASQCRARRGCCLRPHAAGRGGGQGQWKRSRAAFVSRCVHGAPGRGSPVVGGERRGGGQSTPLTKRHDCLLCTPAGASCFTYAVLRRPGPTSVLSGAPVRTRLGNHENAGILQGVISPAFRATRLAHTSPTEYVSKSLFVFFARGTLRAPLDT